MIPENTLLKQIARFCLLTVCLRHSDNWELLWSTRSNQIPLFGWPSCKEKKRVVSVYFFLQPTAFILSVDNALTLVLSPTDIGTRCCSFAPFLFFPPPTISPRAATFNLFNSLAEYFIHLTSGDPSCKTKLERYARTSCRCKILTKLPFNFYAKHDFRS
ncbi:unnamed protein product [Ilex paraguariensis]|uniref:Uncharacterized protein n=1 Tax=Ilex paraguariensis TaxID=185542 RepID=A0ABC8QXW8_9AQUA